MFPGQSLTITHLDKGSLVPAMSTHGGYSFPGPNTLFGRVHRVSRSPFLRSDGSSLSSDGSGPSSPTHRFITPSPPSGKAASLTPGIIYTIIFNTLVRRMPVLKTLNSLNLISTVRGGTKNPLKIINHAQGTVPGLPGASILPVLRAFRNPKKFLQVRWDASPNPHYYTQGTRLRVYPIVSSQPIFRSIRT